jgi:hypothetical protein
MLEPRISFEMRALSPETWRQSPAVNLLLLLHFSGEHPACRKLPMTIFSSTASPGQRWKMFLPGAALIESDVVRSTRTAAALIRGRWSSSGARRSLQQRLIRAA